MGNHFNPHKLTARVPIVNAAKPVCVPADIHKYQTEIHKFNFLSSCIETVRDYSACVLKSETNHPNLELLKTDAGKPVLKFVARVQAKAAPDPFMEWLHDDKPVRIDWSAFGIEKLQSE